MVGSGRQKVLFLPRCAPNIFGKSRRRKSSEKIEPEEVLHKQSILRIEGRNLKDVFIYFLFGSLI